jgi:hypothetical protein
MPWATSRTTSSSRALRDSAAALVLGAGPRQKYSISRRVMAGASRVSPAATARTAPASCSRVASLSRKPLAPAFSACAGDRSGVEMPSSDPYATAVGGTTLGIGARGNRLFESGWSNGFSELTSAHAWGQLAGELAASGGGPSLVWPEPAYQKGVVSAALTQDPGTRGGPARSVSGTSAYYRTLPLTRHSPALQRGEYCPAAVCGRAGLITVDDQDPSMIGYNGQVTLPGYDNMTGLGSPNSPRFSQLLRELARS